MRRRLAENAQEQKYAETLATPRTQEHVDRMLVDARLQRKNSK